MGAVGVDPGLQPGPRVHQLGMRKRFRDLLDHGLGRMQRDLMLARPHLDRLDRGEPADIGDPSPFFDQCDLFR